MAGETFHLPEPTAIDEAHVDRLDDSHHRLVFVNGRLDPRFTAESDLPRGAVVGSLQQLLGSKPDVVRSLFGELAELDDAPFTALNTAFGGDGAFVFVPDGVVVEKPIELIFVSHSASGASMSHPRNLLHLGRESRATVVERYFGQSGDRYFTNVVNEITLGDAASLDHYKVQRENRDSYHIAMTQVQQAKQSRFSSHYFSFGGALARNELNCVLDGEHIECVLNGTYQASGDQLMDQRTRIEHAFPDCDSFELYKGILDDRARGVFNGKIYVHPDAQKTDAKQSNQVLLLSDDAVIDTKPQLEIYADDVKCTHGATVGDLDEGAMHYLRSRGIPADLARSMLIYAFANDVVRGVSVDSVRRHVQRILVADQGLPEVEGVL